MSVLTEINTTAVVNAATESQAVHVAEPIVIAVRSAIASEFWAWYGKHKDDTVTTVHFWIFSRDIRVSDLHAVFTLLFGGDGEDQSTERPPATVPPPPVQVLS